MKSRRIYLQWAVYFGAALVCQLLFHDFPRDFFAFPVNAACVLLCCVVLWIVCREKPQSWFSELLSAPQSTCLVVFAFFLSCLALGLGFGPQADSWWFVMVLAALLAVLLYTVFRGVSRRRVRIRFLLIHVGLFVALLGGFAGSADTQQWRVMVPRDVSVNEAFDAEGGKKTLSWSFLLESFMIEYHEDGVPRDFEAVLDMDGKQVRVKVNHPYRLSAADELYLVDYEHVTAGEQAGYCILEIVHQPWKYLQWAGIWMLVAGSVLLFIQGIPLAAKDRKEPEK